MRLIFGALFALFLAACVSSSPPGTATASSADPHALATAPPEAATGQAINLDTNADTINALENRHGDLWVRIRRGFAMTDLNSSLVQMQLNWYVKHPDYVQRMTDRSQRYLYHVVEELERRHMPTELALLPFIESAYNPQALSIAKAAGIWQFIPDTGRTYNLKQNMFQDERRDVLASTSAALDYLSKLHDMFGDWYLALAAYNWGEGNVQRAIARNRVAGRPTDYLSLRLPSETRHYAPKLQAIKNIIANPQAYGVALPEIPDRPYFVTVTTSRDIDVSKAAQLAGLPLSDFKALNPSFTKPVILGATQPQILLPLENANSFARNLKSYDQPLSTWTTYTLTQRARPAMLARKIGVDPVTLISVNKIPAGMRLKPGSTVLVPRSDDDDEDISADVAETARLAMEPDLPDTRKMLIRVRRRQSIAMLARRYGVTVAQIQQWNKTRRRVFAPGQVVVLHVPTRSAQGKARAMPLQTVAVGGKGRNSLAMRASAKVRGARVTKSARRARPVSTSRASRKTARKVIPQRRRTIPQRRAARSATKTAASNRAQVVAKAGQKER